MKNILLINPYSKTISGVNRATIEPPLGLAYIASLLESKGHRCQIIDAQILCISAKDIISHIKFKPDIIGISANIVTYPAALKVAEKLRSEFKDTFIILGGPYPSSLPEVALNNPYIDAVVIGEGELTMQEVVDKLEKGEEPFLNTEGLAYKYNGKIIFNNSRKLIEDLDILPYPAYHLLPDLKIYKSRARKLPVGQIFTSRGCPYQCIFCNKNIFGHKFRARNPLNVIGEIEWLIEKYKIKQLDILDDNFNFDLSRAKEIFKLIIERNYKLAINLQNGLRIDNIDNEFLDLMKESGVFKISLGIESTVPSIQKRIKKILDLNKVKYVIKEAQKRKIIVYANFILGLPGDTPQTMQETIKFAIDSSADIANFMIALPLPGTEMYEEIKTKGYFLVSIENGVEKGFYANQIFYELEDTKAKDVLRYYRKAYKNFYFRVEWIINSLKTIRSYGELLWFKDAIIELIKSNF